MNRNTGRVRKIWVTTVNEKEKYMKEEFWEQEDSCGTEVDKFLKEELDEFAALTKQKLQRRMPFTHHRSRDADYL